MTADPDRELPDLLYALSHDLGAPLRVIDGFSEALLEEQQNLIEKKETFGAAMEGLLEGAGAFDGAFSEGLADYLAASITGEVLYVETRAGERYLVDAAGKAYPVAGEAADVVRGTGAGDVVRGAALGV